MSSPPNSATSPVSASRKRPSIAGGGGSMPPNPKRRKPSTASTSTHPLRQTSFPPTEQAASSRMASYSPVYEGNASLAGSAASSGGRGRKRGRKAADARSTTAGSATGTGGANATADGQGSIVNGASGRRAEEEEEVEDDDIEDTVLEEGGKMDEAAAKQDREHLAMLIDAFDQDQANRYDVWRRVKLKKETVRRITNQTLSQSVPASIVTTINGYTKLFIGELIERARDVQTEWLAASPTLPTGEPNPAYHPAATTHANGHERSSSSNNSQNPPQEAVASPTARSSIRTVEERDRGPLTPCHLREALRRYKKDRIGGSSGVQGLSLHGKEGVASRAGGNRLFR